jgi:hypothetical protein
MGALRCTVAEEVREVLAYLRVVVRTSVWSAPSVHTGRASTAEATGCVGKRPPAHERLEGRGGGTMTRAAGWDDVEEVRQHQAFEGAVVGGGAMKQRSTVVVSSPGCRLVSAAPEPVRRSARIEV